MRKPADILLNQLDKFNEQLIKLNKSIKEIKEKRIAWCRKNRNEIKKLYPSKAKLYIINNVNTAFRFSFDEDLLNQVYYFKPICTTFNPHYNFSSTYGEEFPTAIGDILNKDGKLISRNRDVYITHLVETQKDDATQVYVMIDNHTGYYKIGKSTNPKYREKTLQSEKPSIHMMFYHEGCSDDEKALHKMFQDKRIRGEWFDLNGSDVKKIKEYFNTKS
jgi:hypothetical protein